MDKRVHPLNVPVADSLFRQWVQWFSPSIQPFIVPTDGIHIVERTDAMVLSAELRDTYCLYGLPQDHEILWLSEAQFSRLARPQRAALVRGQRVLGRGVVPSVVSWSATVGERVREQADGHRFLWWPSLLRGHQEVVLTAFVEDRRLASQHENVLPATWRAAAPVLPNAELLAGTFAPGSGPNCFGTVMAAAGVEGAQTQWMLQEPFEHWLSRSSRPGGQDCEAGTVLVWRSTDGLAQHAALTLGEGWVLHKQCQGWMSPRSVLAVADCIRSSRVLGHRLERHSLTR